MTSAVVDSAQSPAETRIGWSGDFYTASDAHWLLGKCLEKQIREIDALLGHPGQLTVLEMGPGKGLLARDLLQACNESQSNYSQRLRYILIERSPIMRQAQEENLRGFVQKGWTIEWFTSLNELSSESVEGVIFSNELVDAFPVHRVTVAKDQVREIFVNYKDGKLGECVGDLSTTDISSYLDGVSVGWPDGYTTEVHLESERWLQTVAKLLRRGFVLTIDYGHTAQDYYDVSRKDGTLLCYHRHRVCANPYIRVGEQDMTAHVNFTALAKSGSESGLTVTGFTNLMNFLLGLEADRMLAALDPESDEMQAAIRFLRPQSMGQTFKVLIQHKQVDGPSLAGLKFRPFFEGALLGQGQES